jgi:hypothetical protein
MTICSSARVDGTPCKARSLPGRSHCFAHDAAQKAARDAGRLAGGKNKATNRRLDKLTPASLRPVLATLYAALDGLEDGSLEPRVAVAMASVASVIVKVHDASEAEARLAALEGVGASVTG